MTGRRRILRYGFGERLVHTGAAVSYVYGLLTGLAFWAPGLYWIAVALGGGYLSRLLHPWAGLVFTAFVVWMWMVWRGDMRLTAEDRAWRAAMDHYVRNEDAQVPPAGRFNYGQKMLFWVMALGGAAMFLSGLVLWFVDSIPPGLHTLLGVATLIHVGAALVTIGGFIIHVYMGIFVVPGGVTAIVNGDVTEEWAKAHHPLWYATLRSTGTSRSSDPEARPPMTNDARPGT